MVRPLVAEMTHRTFKTLFYNHSYYGTSVSRRVHAVLDSTQQKIKNTGYENIQKVKLATKKVNVWQVR